mgnify:CR=1 FL=1
MTPAALVLAAGVATGASADPTSPEPRPEYGVPVVHDVSLLIVQRAAESVLWPDPFSRPSQFGARYEEAFTKPPAFYPNRRFFEWDGDSWFVNAVGHPLMGSELYLRPRMCHLPWYGALAFAAAGTVLWEYGFEANGARPSANDLVITPLVGFGLGEARYALYQVAQTIESPGWRGVVRVVADPFGEIERAAGTVC